MSYASCDALTDVPARIGRVLAGSPAGCQRIDGSSSAVPSTSPRTAASATMAGPTSCAKYRWNPFVTRAVSVTDRDHRASQRRARESTDRLLIIGAGSESLNTADRRPHPCSPRALTGRSSAITSWDRRARCSLIGRYGCGVIRSASTLKYPAGSSPDTEPARPPDAVLCRARLVVGRVSGRTALIADACPPPRRGALARVSSNRPAAVIVLAAGEGTRMKSRDPEGPARASAAARLLGHALAAARGSSPSTWSWWSATAATRSSPHLAEVDARRRCRRPGRAARHRPRRRSARCDGLPADARRHGRRHLRRRPAAHRRHAARAASPTHERARQRGHGPDRRVADPTGYGRIVRDGRRRASRAIVEHKDADRGAAGDHRDQLRHLRLRRAPCCATRSAGSAPTTPRASSTSPTSLAHRRATPADRVGALPRRRPWQIEGVNDRVQLAALGARAEPPRLARALDARRRHGRRPGDDLGRRRRHARARRHAPARARSCDGATQRRRRRRDRPGHAP